MKFTINDGASFTLNVRLYAHTMFKNAYSSFMIRVCGEETPSAINPAYKLFVYGHETGNAGSMSTATRYG
jgi:hypothetical protein